jgi:hypothetical protein
VAQVSWIYGSYDEDGLFSSYDEDDLFSSYEEDGLFSSYNEGTLYSPYVDEPNAIMTETWSTATLTNPNPEPFEDVRHALESCSHRSPSPAAREAEQPTRLTQSQLEAAKMGTHCAIAKFMAQDMAEMPRSTYNPRVSAALQAYITNRLLTYNQVARHHMCLLWRDFHRSKSSAKCRPTRPRKTYPCII